MYGYTGITLYEFPHSEIFGSKVACTSPKLIAAYHVLHRLLVPRHSPYALNNLTFGLSSGFDFRHIFKTVACHKIFLNLLMILQST